MMIGMDGIVPFAMLGDVQQSIAALGSGFTVKGVVTKANLPATGELGDLYLVSDEGYASYVWDGDSWELKDGDVATNAEIDAAIFS